jgi:hypothetical protein
MSFVFCMTWWFAYPAFIRDPNQEMVDFYPIFSVLNSWTGVFVFCLLGVVSKPFRKTLFGGGRLNVSAHFCTPMHGVVIVQGDQMGLWKIAQNVAQPIFVKVDQEKQKV